MVNKSMLGVFENTEGAVAAADGLKAEGITEFQVLSDSPYPEGAFGEPPSHHRLYVFPLIGAALGLFFGFTGFTAWRMRGHVQWLSRLAGFVLLLTAALFGLLGLALLPISLYSNGTIWTSNQNAWIFFPLDLLLLGPAVRWLRTGRATLAAWSRIYIDLRFLMIVIGWTGVVALQDNSAFAVAVGLTLAGLRMQPLKGGQERDPSHGMA